MLDNFYVKIRTHASAQFANCVHRSAILAARIRREISYSENVTIRLTPQLFGDNARLHSLQISFRWAFDLEPFGALDRLCKQEEQKEFKDSWT